MVNNTEGTKLPVFLETKDIVFSIHRYSLNLLSITEMGHFLNRILW